MPTTGFVVTEVPVLHEVPVNVKAVPPNVTAVHDVLVGHDTPASDTLDSVVGLLHVVPLKCRTRPALSATSQDVADGQDTPVSPTESISVGALHRWPLYVETAPSASITTQKLVPTHATPDERPVVFCSCVAVGAQLVVMAEFTPDCVKEMLGVEIVLPEPTRIPWTLKTMPVDLRSAGM